MLVSLSSSNAAAACCSAPPACSFCVLRQLITQAAAPGVRRTECTAVQGAQEYCVYCGASNGYRLTCLASGTPCTAYWVVGAGQACHS